MTTKLAIAAALLAGLAWSLPASAQETKSKTESAKDKLERKADQVGDKLESAKEKVTEKIQRGTAKIEAKTERADVKNAQQALKEKGHDPGPVDGVMGPRTQAALSDFQKAQGLPESGSLDEATVAKLEIRSSARTESAPSASPTTIPGAPPAGKTQKP